MNEATAREVLLLQAFESAVPPTLHWRDEDGAWATRLASSDAATPGFEGRDTASGAGAVAGAETARPAATAGADPSAAAGASAGAHASADANTGAGAGADADAAGVADSAWTSRASADAAASARRAAATDAFLAARARHAMQRLLPREPRAAWSLGRRVWRPRWIGVAIGVGTVAGLVANGIGGDQRINLLAPPVWTVVAWNLGVYLVLAFAAVTGALRERTSGAARGGGWARSLAMRLLTGPSAAERGGAGTPGPSTDPVPAVLADFAARWFRLTAPLSALRAATLLHAGAAALGLGLIAGFYLRGLVLDYRVAWESTFLSAADVHAWLATLFAPASLLSGIVLPDTAGVAALQVAHGSAAPGAPAAAWIHLYAWTLLLAVVLPRTALAAMDAARARWQADHLRLPLAEPYFDRLLRRRRGDPARVQLVPYAQTPAPRALQTLRDLLVAALGDRLDLNVGATIAYGADGPSVTAGTALAVALFDLAATPEPETHGRFAAALASRAPTIVLVDEAGFRRRFGASGERLAQRRAAWQRFADALGSVAVCVDLDAAASSVDLQAALARPVRAHARAC